MNAETLNIVLWIVQGILAAVFLLSGVMKLVRSKEQLGEQMEWVSDFSEESIRSIGIVEIVGALMLVLPGLLGILAWVTKYTAVGLGLLMMGALATHLRRQEWAMAAVTAVLALLCAFVWYGRALVAPL